jgi:PAS domain S-box-containing protein
MSARFDRCLTSTICGAGDGAFVIGADGTVTVWNAAAELLLGYTERETLGRGCGEVFAGCDADGNRLCKPDCEIRALAQQNKPIQSFDMQTRTKAGRPLWLNMSVVAVSCDGRVAPRLVYFMRDVTATKELLKRAHAPSAASSDTSGTRAATPQLTRRELDVLRLLTHGLSTTAVAARLHVTRTTARNHVQNILGKLGVHSRLEAVAYAARHRLF